MVRADSISVRDLSSQLKTAVEAALKANAGFAGVEADIRYVPNPGIIGFILRDPQLDNRQFSELSKLAGDVTSKLPQVGAKSQPAFLIRDGGIIVGFFPVAEMLELTE